MKKFLIMGMIFLLLFAAYYMTREPERIAVKVHRLSKGEVKTTVSNTRVGTIEACRRAYLAPSTGGNVAALHVKEGDKVKQQQLLMEVWNADIKARQTLQSENIKTQQARARQSCELAAGAKREARRLQRLQQSNQIISEERVDQAATEARAQYFACQAAKAAVDVANAEREVTDQALERTLVRAPFDGTVAEINAELGEYVTPSPPGIPTLPPIDLLDISCLLVSAPIDEVDAPQLKVGMTACVSLDAFDQPRCSGSLTRIAPYVLEKEKQARTVEVEVTLTEERDLTGLLPGYSADIEVLVDSKVEALRVPTEAVLENNRVLLVDEDGRLLEQEFKAGLANWHYVEVLSGLSEGDTIVLSVGLEGVEAGAYIEPEDD